MGTFLEPSDLTPFADIDTAKAEAMIEDAEAQAMLVAPCLGDDELDPALTEIQVAAVRSYLRGAILRWNEAGTGIRQSITTGPFGETTDTTQQRKGMFWPSEITNLQDICSNGEKGKAFSVDTVGCYGIHSPICSLHFGALYCSCGANIAGFPLYEDVTLP